MKLCVVSMTMCGEIGKNDHTCWKFLIGQTQTCYNLFTAVTHTVLSSGYQLGQYYKWEGECLFFRLFSILLDIVVKSKIR